MSNSARIFDDGTKVIIDIKGQKPISLPYPVAEDFAKEILRVAAVCKELANAAGIIEDQAILIRSGFPVAIARDPRILAEAKKKAEDIDIPGIPKPSAVNTKSIALY